MKKTTQILIGTILFLSIALLSGFIAYSSANDTEIQLRETVLEKQKVCKSNRDKLHQTLFNVAQIPDRFLEKSKEAFKEIYPQLMENRYGDARGGALMSWVTESNPQFDMASASNLYENLQISVEANFKEFDKKQQELISSHKEHKFYIQKTWNNIFWNFKRRGEVDIILLESTKTFEDYNNNGRTDTVNIFE